MADRKIDFEYIKQQIDTDQIISVMDSLGVPFVKQDDKQLIFYSICHHHSDFLQHKPKLYYYIQSKSFYCYVCSFNGDIFSLVQLLYPDSHSVHSKLSFLDLLQTYLIIDY